MPNTQPLLEVNNLKVGFRTDRGDVTAIEDVSFQVKAGEILGIVGESGCGKSVTSRSIMRLLPEHNSFIDSSSEILFDGKNLAQADEKTLRSIRGNRIAMIFQEPMTALNPVFTIGWQLDEALKYHTSMNRMERRNHAIEMLRSVEIPNPEQRFFEYPHQLSGGMRQRVVISLALCCGPELLIADEPTTALDVTIQAQILRLMDDLRKKNDTAVVLITHDLGVIAQVCDRVIVMYAGQIVETSDVQSLFTRPQHPYTRALLESIPQPGPKHHQTRLPTIEGMVPSLFELPSGCRFQDRCACKEDQCVAEKPLLSNEVNFRKVRCFFPINES
ncbi:MAG: peptide ABC transporter ATP-binding protein [Planctomycetaceae bacterium]|nr:peptide ABC transporter ATP-binding protein [Planctomycetaceae bacterium]MCH2595451.1 ABC transporter ATP-binding protein [Pirellulales bacterium]